MISLPVSSRDEDIQHDALNTYRGRFAPSPTGDLHLGSLVAALGSWLAARQANGQWLIRIEDIDRVREVPGAASKQIETLKRFGLVSDLPIVRQSDREELYQQALDKLIDADHAFPCYCSRTDLQQQQAIHRHCAKSTRIDKRKPSWRLRADDRVISFVDFCAGMFSQHLLNAVGDVVLRRADGLWAYQLAVVVDDAEQQITDVVRGSDLLDSTPRQIYLQNLLGLPLLRYAHLPLVRDSSGVKLSKSRASDQIDSDDPIPALNAAWQALQQRKKITDSHGNTERWLTQAISRFTLPKIDLHTATKSTEKPAISSSNY